MRSLRVSAPGKVLLLGGYLVLERPNVGYVVTVNARVHVTVSARDGDAGSATRVRVRSARFAYDAELVIDAASASSAAEEGSGAAARTVLVSGSAGDDAVAKNAFVSYAVLYSAAAARARGVRIDGQLLEVLIVGDEAFYTGSGGKTGLGSSAAMTAALCGALCGAFGVPDERELVHKVAQAAHCAAQGKIGSGFDVAAAVFGSGAYRRFSPELLEALPKDALASGVSVAASVARSVFVDALWDHVHDAVALPPGSELIMGDVSGGSNTPNMVRMVLEWRRSGAEGAARVWHDLGERNEATCALLQLASATSDDFAKAADELKERFASIRVLLRELNASGAEVEPAEQTALCDATMALDGVVMCGVPGAGGFDAVFALTTNAAASSAVRMLWSRWADANVAPLAVRDDNRGLVVTLL